MTHNEITPFIGAVSSIDPRSVPHTAATDHLNVRVEDGSLRFRYGFRNLAAAQSGFSAIHGLAYIQGYDTSSRLEEILSVETVSGNARLYSRPVDDGDPATEVKNGVTSVNLNASEWVFTMMDGDAYLINPSNSSAPVYRKTIGVNNDLTALAVPDAPSVKLSYVISYGPGSTSGYTTLLWTGIDPTSSGEVAVTGSAANTGSSLLSDNTLSVRHLTTELDSSVQIDFSDGSLGVQNFTNNDRFAIPLKCGHSNFDIQATGAEFINNDGSPKTLTPDLFKFTKVSTGSGGAGNAYVLTFGFDAKTRADFDNVRYLKISYKILKASQTDATQNNLIIGGLVVGGVYMWQPKVQGGITAQGLYVGYTYRFSTPGFESGLSPMLFIPNSSLTGNNPLSSDHPPLGVKVEVTATVSADTNVDQLGFYVLENLSGTRRLLATQADSDLTYDVAVTHTEILALPEGTPSEFSFTGVTSAFPYKGSMVWLYKGGSQNVRFSRVGEPLKLASDEDSEDDLAAGATFTLADNFGDEPLGGTQAGDAVMIAGVEGVHATFGNYPSQMFPFRKVAGSRGVAGKYAFCKWKDEAGQDGIAYLSRDGQVCFSIPGTFAAQEVGDTITLTQYVRDGELSPKDFLLEEQASALSLTDFSTAQVLYDERQDALWVVMGLRAMVLRRRNILDGVRYWEHYEYTTGGATVTMRYGCSSPKWGLRVMRSNGKLDELEFNSNTRAFVSGSNSDGGSAAPAGYWESKTFKGPNQRINFVAVERDDLTDTPTVTVYSSRTPAGTAIALASGSKGTRFLPTDQGETYRVRVSLAETYEPIRRLKIELFAAGRRRDA